MKFIFAFVMIMLSFQGDAQILNRDSVAGTWLCVEVKVLPDTEFNDPKTESIMKTLKTAYLGSTFTFGVDGKFLHTLTKTELDYTEMFEFLNGQNWYFDQAKKRISIGKPSENLMHIELVEKNKVVHFALIDLPLMLRMEKK